MAKKIVCFTLDERVVEVLDRIASMHGMSRSKLLQEVFEKALDRLLEQQHHHK